MAMKNLKKTPSIGSSETASFHRKNSRIFAALFASALTGNQEP